MAVPGEFSPALVRTVRALALIGKPISVRSLSGSFKLTSTIAALRWLLAGGYVASGTSRSSDTLREPVYWLTDRGHQLHQQLCATA